MLWSMSTSRTLVFRNFSASPVLLQVYIMCQIASLQASNMTSVFTDDWSCTDESLARHSLIFRCLIHVLCGGSAKASHEESTEEALEFAINHAKSRGLCKEGDAVVALHRLGASSVIKIVNVK